MDKRSLSVSESADRVKIRGQGPIARKPSNKVVPGGQRSPVRGGSLDEPDPVFDGALKPSHRTVSEGGQV